MLHVKGMCTLDNAQNAQRDMKTKAWLCLFCQVEGMGGANSECYQAFRKQCYTAFLHLRRLVQSNEGMITKNK